MKAMKDFREILDGFFANYRATPQRFRRILIQRSVLLQNVVQRLFCRGSLAILEEILRLIL